MLGGYYQYICKIMVFIACSLITIKQVHVTNYSLQDPGYKIVWEASSVVVLCKSHYITLPMFL